LAGQVVLDVQPEGRRDDRNLQIDAGAELTQGLTEPVVVHPPTGLPEETPSGGTGITAVFV
jgi:hypothetical protein